MLNSLKIFKLMPIMAIPKRTTVNKQIKVMKKIMAGRDKGKRRWHYEEYPKMTSNVQKFSNPEHQGKEVNRRIKVLNFLFMKNVTDLMATGVFAEILYGHGIQITTCKVAPDFRKLNIYWISNMTCDEEVDRKLRSIAGPLRHELSVLRLMGEVPQINFVRDKSLARSAQVDVLLKEADYGEDFVPTDPTLFFKRDPILEYTLSEDERNKLRELEEDTDDIIEELPPMRHDIYGLDHDRIMKSVMASMSKSTKAWELYGAGGLSGEEVREPVDVNKYTRDAELREDFVKFLEKRQIEKKITPERKRFHRHFNLDDSEEVEEYKDIPDNDFIEEK